MSSDHIFIDPNEIRITDDSGGPAVHIIRPAVLDRDYYNSIPLTASQRQTQGVTNTSTLASSQLTVAVDAGCMYKISGFIEWGATGLALQQVKLLAPAGSIGSWCGLEILPADSTANPVALTAVNASLNADNGLTTSASWVISGWLMCGATGGSCTVQFAHNSGDVRDQTLSIVNGSWITLQRIA
jgi:hypothetical protein